jgi:hypothetical protein
MWQSESAAPVLPRDCPAHSQAQGPQRKSPSLLSLPLPASCSPQPFAAAPCAAAPPPWPLRKPLRSPLRAASRPSAPLRSLSENAPCLDRVFSDCWAAPLSSCSSPSWSRGTRPYFSPPLLVNSNPCFSNTFACLHLSGRIVASLCSSFAALYHRKSKLFA